MAAAELYLRMVQRGNRGDQVLPGEVAAEGYEGQIELTNWTWGLGIAGSEGKDKRGVTGRPNDGRAAPSTFTISKPLDASSLGLIKGLRTYSIFPEAKISLLHGVDAGISIFITLTNVQILDYKMTVKGGEKAVTLGEVWIFNYETVAFEYKGNESRTAPNGKTTVKPVVNDFIMPKPPGSDYKPAVKVDDKSEGKGAAKDEPDPQVRKVIEFRKAGKYEAAADAARKK